MTTLEPVQVLQGSSALDTATPPPSPSADASGSGRRPSLSPLRAVAVFDPGEARPSDRPGSPLHADTVVTRDASTSDRHPSLSPLRGDTVLDPDAGARAEQAEDADARAAQRWFDEAETPPKARTLPPGLAAERRPKPATDEPIAADEDRTPSDDLDPLPMSPMSARVVGVGLATALALAAWALWGR